MDTMTPDQIRSALEGLDGWEPADDAIRREFEFDDFRAAIGFINGVADLAEDANHHPEITNVYNKVTLELSSHDAGGVTQRDIDLARAIDQIAGTS